MPGPPVANYGTTKAANISQAVSLAKELGGTGVTANTVSPGPIRTPGMEAGAREMMTTQGQEYDFHAFEQFYVQQTRLPAGKMKMSTNVGSAALLVDASCHDNWNSVSSARVSVRWIRNSEKAGGGDQE